jgi:hypothetical protein
MRGSVYGMSLKDLFHIFRKNDYEKELKKKIHSLEMKVEKLQHTLIGIEEKTIDTTTKQPEPPIIIEKINIEKIILDKYELNNNFGQLGIKELKGKLNIGATYGSEFTPKPDGEEKENSVRREKIKKPSKNGPKINIHSKQ